MNDYSAGYIGVQLPMNAKPEQVRFAVAAILTAFNLAPNDTIASGRQDPFLADIEAKTDSTPAAQVTPAQVANAELDKDNLPWDARIHASTKTKTQKGMWTRKKGLADSTYDAIVAELRQQYAAPTPAAPVAPATPAVTVPGVPTAPAVSIPTAPATPYAKLCDWLARNTGEGKPLTADWANGVFTSNNTTLAALANDQEASQAFLDAFINAAGVQ